MHLHVLSAEELHSKQSEDENEEKEQEQKRDDWTHAVEQRNHQIAKRRPVPEQQTFSSVQFLHSAPL